MMRKSLVVDIAFDAIDNADGRYVIREYFWVYKYIKGTLEYDQRILRMNFRSNWDCGVNGGIVRT